MSLTLPSAFTTKTILKENWLVQLWYDDEGQGKYSTISFYDTVIDDGEDVIKDYVGCILNKPTIRESVDLENSTAKTSNVSLTIANFIHGDGNHFSRQLLNGTNHYINRTVKIYIQPNNETLLSNCVQIYTGRLEQVSHTVDKISLSIVAKRPWDKITIPSQDDKTTNNIYKPVVYGDYVDNATEGASNDVYGTYIAHPIKYCTEIDREQYYLTGQGSNGTKGALFWDKYLQKFSAIDDSSSTSGTILGEKALKFPISSVKSNHFWLDSVRVSPQSPVSDASWVDTANIFLGSGFAYYSNPAVAQGTTVTKYLYLNCPNIDGEASQLSFVISMRQEGNVGGSNSLYVRIKYEDDGTQLGAKSFSSNESDVLTANFQTEYNSQSKKMPDYVTIEVSWSAGLGSIWNAGSSQFKIYEARFETEYNYPNDATRKLDSKAQEFLYSGADGQISTIDESPITEIHEAHRDILHRYTSYASSNTPTNWSSGLNINSVKDWKIRYWIIEPTPLIEVLEKLQHEGGFIGRFDGQGSYQYIFIPDSPSASVTLDEDDISDLTISSTGVNSLTSKMHIEYQKHPAESRYITSETSVSANDATLLSNFNIASTENKKTIKLDAYVSPTIPTSPSTNSNDDYYTYYDHILGKPRIIVNFTVVNPAYLGLDVGDMIEIDFNNVVRPFGGGDWVGEDGDGYIFMITDVSRSVGNLKITAREI